MTYEVFRNENGRYYIASVDNKGFHEVPEVWTSMNQFASREQAECQARERNPYNKASGKLRISHEGDKWYWAFPPREGDVESGEVVCLATPAPKRFDLEVWQLAHFPFASPVEIVRWSLSGSGLKDGENARLSAMSQWGIISFLLRKSTEASMNLYWCETVDHDEDWFIVVPSVKEARHMHEDSKGYERGEAWATLVLRIPTTLASSVGYPTHDLLRSLGLVFISEETPRVVQIGQTVYQEGGMDAVVARVNDDVSEAIGKGRPNKTTKQH